MKKLLILLMSLSVLLCACGSDAAPPQQEEQQAPPPQQSVLADGSIELRTYHANGQLATVSISRTNGEQGAEYYDENGQLERFTIHHAEGGSLEEVFRAGELISSTTVNADGHSEIIEYRDGLPLHMTIKQIDGSIGSIEYENGLPCRGTFSHPDGGSTVMEYAEGVLLRETYTNGDHLRQTDYHRNGKPAIICESYKGSTVFTEYYDEAGRLTERYATDNSGRPVHTVYHADGSSTTYVSNADGTAHVVQFDSSGNLLSSTLAE